MYDKIAGIIETDLADELILLDPASGEMFSLNDTGRRVWRALPAPSVAEVARGLVAALEVDQETAERDVAALLDRLVRAGLVSWSG
jgi:hypothetical protein